MRMNPPKYHGSKVEENPVEFNDEIYRIVVVTRVPSEEKVELVAYQLKGVAKVWYDQWIEKRGEKVAPIA